ncbi:MAG: PAS domain-containing sensor histidine kinase [Bacteroidota bacterium]
MDLLNSILDNIDEGIIIIDTEGKILFFNEVAINKSKAVSINKPLQLGERLEDTVSPHRKEIICEMINEIKLKKQSNQTFAEYTNNLGTTVYLETTFVPVVDEAGDLASIQLFIRDITLQKIFEKKLTTQVANVSNLIEKANAVIIGIDTSGYITDWNEHCYKITGFDKDEVYAQKLIDVLLKEEERPVFELLMLRILNHELVSNYEIPVYTKAGKRVTFLLSATPRSTATGEIIGVTFVGQDVTELTGYRKSLEIKVEEKTRELKRILKKEKEVVEMKSRFISIASHEFRTPLSSIQHAAHFIKQHQRISPEDLTKRLDGIEIQVGHMTSLLDDVLTYGKNEAGKIQLIITKIVLLDFTNNIVEEVGHSTKNTHTIHLNFQQLPGEIATDEKLLRNILINLLTNAVKFSPGQEHVYLTLSGLTNHIKITVRDEGMGIPETEMDKIFEPFLRGKAATSIQGTGLGLSIVKKGVELLGGTIRVESQVDMGTTFTVTIPEQ